MHNDSYIPIDDWSVEGRRSFFEANEWHIRDLLDLSFTKHIDDGGALATYGFRGDDLIIEAVAFCIERFTAGELSKERMNHRSTEIFTRVPFWLTQKVGKQAYQAKKKRAVETLYDETGEERFTDERAHSSRTRRNELCIVKHTMGRTLKQLRQKTCAELLGHWLRGSAKWRGSLPGTQRPPTPPSDIGKATRSRVQADALLRFMVLGAKLMDTLEQTAHRVIDTSWFGGANKAPHYRTSDADVAAHLSLQRTRTASQGRKEATETLIRAGISLAHEQGTDNLWSWIARNSLLVSACDAHGLEGAPYRPLRNQLKLLRQGQEAP